MTTSQKFFCVISVALSALVAASGVYAAVTTALTLTAFSGDAVQVSITAEGSKQIKLSFLPPGEATVRTIVLGSTDENGRFSTTVSSGGYGIPASSPVFVAVAGVQSPMMLWPAYTSSLTLDKTSVRLAVGQRVTINGSAALILAANSQTDSIATSLTGSQVTITGLGSGFGTVTLCATNAGCRSISVEVGAQTGQTQIAFSPDTPTLSVGQSQSIVVTGGGTSGYSISSNSHPTVVDPSFSGSRRVLYLYANAAGSSTITVCSVETATNCNSLVVTVLDSSAQSLSFSPESLTVIPGLTQRTTVSGGSDSNYFISSNSHSSTAQATVSGSIVTVVGGSTFGSTVITVCSTSTNNRCGSFTVTLNPTSNAPSGSMLSFSQNVVSVAAGETTNVTITGGNNSGYAVASNSNPTAVTAAINGNSNVFTITGNASGTAVVSVCSVTAGDTCASVHVTVGQPVSTILLSQSTASLTPGSKALIAVTGGSSTSVIASNTNLAAVSAMLSANGAGLVLTGGTIAGTAVITVCPTASSTSSKCATVTATTAVANSPAPSPAPAPPSAPPQSLRVKKVKVVRTLLLNVRKSNTTKSAIVGRVKQNQVFSVLEENGGWYRIEAPGNIRGWISAAYAVRQ